MLFGGVCVVLVDVWVVCVIYCDLCVMIVEGMFCEDLFYWINGFVVMLLVFVVCIDFLVFVECIFVWFVCSELMLCCFVVDVFDVFVCYCWFGNLW